MGGKAPLVYHPRISRLRLYAVLSGLLLASAIFIMLNLEQLQYGVLRLVALIFGGIGVIGFVYLFGFNLMRALKPKDLLTLDEDGISYYISPLARGEIPWDNVKSYGLVKYGLRKMLVVHLHRPQEYMNPVKGLRKQRMRASMKRFDTPFTIPADLLPEDVEGILIAIKNYRR